MNPSLLSFAALLLAAAPSVAADAPLPNFVVILIDDMGYGDIGPFGSKVNRTPHLDRMAAKGMKLTSFYAAPVCTPSRAQMMTGCYAKRVSMPNVIFPSCPTGLSAQEHTVASLLKQQGYATMCVGKWHLGDQPEFLPTQRGFDHYLGLPYSNDMGRPPLPLLRDANVLEAVRSGPWKLAIAPQAARKANAKGKIAKPAGPRLYNLDIDIGEKTDVAAEHPEIVKRLEGYVEQMDSDLGVNKNGPGVRPPDRVENPKPLLKRVDTEYD